MMMMMVVIRWLTLHNWMAIVYILHVVYELTESVMFLRAGLKNSHCVSSSKPSLHCLEHPWEAALHKLHALMHVLMALLKYNCYSHSHHLVRLQSSPENPCPNQGPVLNIRLGQTTESLPQPDGTFQPMVVDTYLQLNYSNGEFKKLQKIRGKDGGEGDWNGGGGDPRDARSVAFKNCKTAIFVHFVFIFKVIIFIEFVITWSNWLRILFLFHFFFFFLMLEIENISILRGFVSDGCQNFVWNL